MERCDLIDTCAFLNDKMIDMPLTTHKLLEKYCVGDFTLCSIHRVAMTQGIDKVPSNVFPGDKYELSDRVIELALWGKLGW